MTCINSGCAFENKDDNIYKSKDLKSDKIDKLIIITSLGLSKQKCKIEHKFVAKLFKYRIL